MRSCVLAACVIFVATGMSCGSGSQVGGPLTGSLPGEIGVPVDVGHVVTVGYASLFNPGKAEARVEGLRLLPPDQLDLVEVRTELLPRDGGGIISLPDFPPEGYPSRPLAEQNVVAGAVPRAPGEPAPNLQFILGVRTNRPGVIRTDEVEVTYRVGKRRFVEAFPVKIILCAPAAPYFGGCNQFTQPKAG
jgi:hypothetical protein